MYWLIAIVALLVLGFAAFAVEMIQWTEKPMDYLGPDDHA